jgi:hypothetical protein
VTTATWIYLAVAVLSWRFIAGSCYGADGVYDAFHAVLLGAAMALIWPAPLIFSLVWKACVTWPDAMHAIFIHEPSRARRERRRERLQAEIQRLERELDVK